MVEVSLWTEMVELPVPSAVTDKPVTPEEVEPMVLLWLVKVPPPLTEYCKFFPRCRVPANNPVAARKLPVTSWSEMPTSPVVLLASWKSPLTAS